MAAFEFKQNELLGKVASVDTNLLFNAGIIAGSAGDLEKSSAAFSQCIEMGYKGITYSATDVMGEPKQYLNKEAMEIEITAGLASDPVVGEDVRPSIYISLINNAKKMDKIDSYNKWLTEAREAYPENIDLLDIQLQAYLDVKDYEGAMNNLNEAIAKNPEKGIYHFVKGNIMQTEMKDLDGALAEYKAALEVEPDMSDALYMCGLVYIDRANNITEEMNSLSLSQTTKYNKLKADQKSIFQESLEYFESAYEMKSDDIDIVQALMEVYRKVGNYEKSMEMKAILDEAEE
jgi:tetratricopeptide (TPR) repeat protein